MGVEYPVSGNPPSIVGGVNQPLQRNPTHLFGERETPVDLLEILLGVRSYLCLVPSCHVELVDHVPVSPKLLNALQKILVLFLGPPPRVSSERDRTTQGACHHHETRGEIEAGRARRRKGVGWGRVLIYCFASSHWTIGHASFSRRRTVRVCVLSCHAWP